MKPEENNGFTVSPQIVNNRRISRKTMSTDRFCLICHDKIHDRHYKIASSLSSINQLIIEITASSETSVVVQGQLLKIWHRMLIYHTTWICGP